MQFCYSCMQQLENQRGTICPHCGEPLAFTYDTTRYLKPGTVLHHKFLVGRTLGTGGFGNTYIGWEQSLQRKVAIKEYYPKQLSSRCDDGVTVAVTDTVSQKRFRMGLTRFLEEARRVAGLKDVKGVVQVYNFFEENGTGYIVMEYLEGKDVKTILAEQGGRMDYEWSRRVILTVLYTLREIHKRGVLHRDIAPDNIFVTSEGVIKLIDFGAAKYAARLADENAEVVLKSGYAPLEQYSNKNQQGPYTDIYAVAAVFYRLLTGTKPQPAIERKMEDRLQMIEAYGVQIPQQAEYAIMTCLNLEPQYRLESAGEFMEALDGADFVPVDEPEWILPEVQEKTAIRQIKGKIMHMPVWKKVVAVVVVLLLVGGGVGLTKAVWETATAPKNTISQNGDALLPSCEQLSETEAVNKLEKLGVSVVKEYTYQQDCKTNTVKAMQPAAGSVVQKDQKVTLTVASSQLVSIPDYKGKTEAEIQADLKNRLQEQYADTMLSYHYTDASSDKGKCYGQTATGVVHMSEIGAFQVQFSWGKQEAYEVTMPNLVGKTVKQAQKTLKKAGIKTKIAEGEPAYDSEGTEGEIIYQNIEKGTVINKNKKDKQNYSVPETVVVTVSMGIRPTPTPQPTPKPKQTPAPKKSKEKKNKNSSPRDTSPFESMEDDAGTSW